MTYKIVLLPGDGIGPEITEAATGALKRVGEKFGIAFAFDIQHLGGIAIDETGEPCPDATVAACKGTDAIFLGAVGGPKWDNAPVRPEAGLLKIRKELGLFANLRPTVVHPKLVEQSPLRAELVAGADFLIVRELTGGIYFGKKARTETEASDLCAYSVPEVERVARVAFEAARKRDGRLTSIDKANVLETSRLWRATVTRLGETEFSDVALDHLLVDAAAMHLIQRPKSFDVIVTENMFGDILSDEASVLTGSIGTMGSASLGGEGPGLFEPIHGSAPDIAGQDKANPIGAIASASMLLRHGLGLGEPADAVDAAISRAIGEGRTTGDLGGGLSGSAAAQAICDLI